jgi:hypothetical protein
VAPSYEKVAGPCSRLNDCLLTCCAMLSGRSLPTFQKCLLPPSAMLEAANTSETSVNFYQTIRRNISEDSHLHTRRREKLKSHLQDCLIIPTLKLRSIMLTDSHLRLVLRSVVCSFTLTLRKRATLYSTSTSQTVLWLLRGLPGTKYEFSSFDDQSPHSCFLINSQATGLKMMRVQTSSNFMAVY